MNKKNYNEIDLNHSYSNDIKSPDQFSYKPKKFDKDFNKTDHNNNYDKSLFQQTNYTTTSTKNQFIGIKKISQNLSNIRQTFSYVPIHSDKHYPQQKFKYKNNQYNSFNDLFKQTLDFSIYKNKGQSNFAHLQRSASGNLNEGYIKSQNKYFGNILQSKNDLNKLKYRYSKNIQYNKIQKTDQEKYQNYNTYNLKNSDDPITKLKQQRQLRKQNKHEQSQQNRYVKSHTVISQQNTQNSLFQNKDSFYTPKIQKSTSIHKFPIHYPLSPIIKKDISCDKNMKYPNKVSDIKYLKKQLQNFRQNYKKKNLNNLNIKQNFKTNLNQRKSFNHKITLEDFSISKNLGKGRFGSVNLCFHKATGAVFAMKKIKKQIIKSNKLIEQFIKQVKLQCFLVHPFILKMYGLFDDQEYVYIILQFLQQGTLFNYLKQLKKIPQKIVAQKIRYISQAIKYLQDRGIAHRDIKPENIIMTNNVCKLADFGWATFCDQQRRRTYCGTCDYVAPQILQGQSYDETVDLWCMGVLAYQLITGKAPFYHMSRKETMKKIINVKIEYPPTMSEQAKSFIQGLVQKQPQKRMSIEQILNHSFIKRIKLNE